MIVGMYIIAFLGVAWLAVRVFRHADIDDLIILLPGFLALGFVWVVAVMFGGLLLEAFAETLNKP